MLDGRYFLTDALGRLEVEGSALKKTQNGDHVVVEITAKNGSVLVCGGAKVVSRGENPHGAMPGKTIQDFARFLGTVREFFLKRGLSEVLTPTLVSCPGLEPNLEPFAVEIKRARETRLVYLPTSPEIHLKKALTKGWTDIFEIKSVFRKGEFSPHHENEFLMLEWYRAYADLALIQEDLSALLEICGAPKLEVTTFATLFDRHLDFKLTPQTTREELSKLCLEKGVHQTPDDSFNDLFHRLLIDHIEPHFTGALLVRNFPPSQAALAKLTPDGWADRFEFYWEGLEIANAFNEVNDAEELRKRWQAEKEERAHLGTLPLEEDHALIDAIRTNGMPPTAGIALGMERLFMAITGSEEIRDLRLFASDDLFNLALKSQI